MRSYAEAARDPHVLEREMLQVTAHPASDAPEQTVPVTGPAAKLSRTRTRVRHAAPALGADNEQILAELGYDEAALRELREAKVI